MDSICKMFNIDDENVTNKSMLSLLKKVFLMINKLIAWQNSALGRMLD